MGLKGEDLPGHSRREVDLEVLKAAVADLQETMKYTSAARFLARRIVGLGGSQEIVFIKSVELTLKSNKQTPSFMSGGQGVFLSDHVKDLNVISGPSPGGCSVKHTDSFCGVCIGAA